MGYEKAMEAAGATVHGFERFGSYQGDWWAKVTFEGRTGFVNGCFGSCSYCDAFESEFGYSDPRCETHEWDSEGAKDCSGCMVAEAEYEDRLAAFGKEYLDNLMTGEQALAAAGKNIEWDHDAEEMVAWVKANL